MRVVNVDLAPPAELRCDVRHLPGFLFREQPEFMWASPPCTEFSTMKRCAFASGRGSAPDPEKGMVLVRQVWDLVGALRPRWWILENVAGADPFIGPPRLKAGAYHLWGEFPAFLLPQSNPFRKGRGKDRHLNNYPGKGAAKSAASAVIPRALAEAVHQAVCPKGDG
ncbi:MAG: DNA cytosine methyltransferase [Halobacteriota archaeon]